MSDALLTSLIENGNWLCAVEHIRYSPRDILDHRNEVGHNALHCAVLKCDGKNIESNELLDHIIKVSQFTSEAALVTCYEGGWTALHLCCRNRNVPDEIVLKVAKANPRALAVQDEDGDSPLHSACRYGASKSTLQSLIEIAFRNDEISSSSSIFATTDFEGGDLPLHSAISHDATPEIISLFLDAYPPSISALNCSNHHSPLHVAVECCRYDLVQVITKSNAAIGCVCQLLAITDRQGYNVLNFLWHKYVSEEDDTEEVWDCIAKLLIDAEKDSQEKTFIPQTDLNLLYASIRLGPIICPIGIVSHLLSRNPVLLRQRDDKGMLPLHHAISVYPSISFRTDRVKQYQANLSEGPLIFFEDDIEKESSSQFLYSEMNDIEHKDSDEDLYTSNDRIPILESFAMHEEPVADEIDDSVSSFQYDEGFPPLNCYINLFLRNYKESASKQGVDGVYPLQMALKANLPWKNGMEEIFLAYPDAINITDDKGFLPFMMAKSVDCIYHLLRNSPSVVKSLNQVKNHLNVTDCSHQDACQSIDRCISQSLTLCSSSSPKRGQLVTSISNDYPAIKRRKLRSV